MPIPREYYNIEDLANHWKHFEITVSDIEHLLETRKLKAEFKDTGENFIRPGNRLYYIRDLIRLVPNDYKKSIYVSDDIYLFGEIIISSEEVTKFEKYLKGETDPISTPTNNSENPGIAEDNQTFFASAKLAEFDINKYVAQKREEEGCKLKSCFKCKEKSCRSHLAHDLFTNYGDNTPYRSSLCDIGHALGCAKPTWAVDNDDEEQKNRQKKEVNALKSQVRRWIAGHKLK